MAFVHGCHRQANSVSAHFEFTFGAAVLVLLLVFERVVFASAASLSSVEKVLFQQYFFIFGRIIIKRVFLWHTLLSSSTSPNLSVLITIRLFIVIVPSIGINSLWYRFFIFILLLSIDKLHHVCLLLQKIDSSSAVTNSHKLVVECGQHGFDGICFALVRKRMSA